MLVPTLIYYYPMPSYLSVPTQVCEAEYLPTKYYSVYTVGLPYRVTHYAKQTKYAH